MRDGVANRTAAASEARACGEPRGRAGDVALRGTYEKEETRACGRPCVGVREHIQAGLLERGHLSRAWIFLAVRSRRMTLAALISFLPPFLLLVAALLAPPDVLRALIHRENVHDTFSRFVSGVATASSIAVSIATLTLGRDLKAIGTDRERQEADQAYRREVRGRTGKDELPVLLGPFMERALAAMADKADAIRDDLSPEMAGIQVEGLALGDYLEIMAGRAREQARAMKVSRARPDALLLAGLDLETEATARLAERYVREDGMSDALGKELDNFAKLIDDFAIAQRSLKALDVQWSLSRMSIAILVSSVPSLALGAAMTLLYGDGAPAAIGEVPTAILVCVALGVVSFPVSCFVSYLLRFLIVNQHTLPADGFLLGPEAAHLRR